MPLLASLLASSLNSLSLHTLSPRCESYRFYVSLMRVYAHTYHLGTSRAALGAGGLSSDATEILGWANGVQVEGGHGCCGGAAHNLKLQRGTCGAVFAVVMIVFVTVPYSMGSL